MKTTSRLGRRIRTLVADRPPPRADRGLRIDGHWAPERWSPAGRGGQEAGSCASPMGVLPLWCARRCRAYLAHRAPRLFAPERLKRLSYIGRCLGDWLVGWSAASSGSGGSRSALRSRPEVSGVPMLIASERCILAASEWVGGGDGSEVGDPAFSSVAR